LGRRILAKRFQTGVTEYKEIAFELERQAPLRALRAALIWNLVGLIVYFLELEICIEKWKNTR
jgi:hypothetical protein